MDFKVAVVFQLCTLLQGIISEVVNLEELNKGFCHKDSKPVRVALRCDIHNATVTIETSEDLFVQCSKMLKGDVHCHSGRHDRINGVLEYNFTFDHSWHAGKLQWINYTCDNGTQFSESLRLYPCLSGFTAYGTHNGTHVNIECKHILFNMSKGISIVDNSAGNHLITCLNRNQCHPQYKGHPNGIHGFIREYKPGSGFLCTMDGQSIEVDLHVDNTIQGTAKTGSQPEGNGGGHLVSYLLGIFSHFCVTVMLKYTVINV